MISYSIINKSQLECALRLDAEYYQEEYLNVEKAVKDTGSFKEWGSLNGKFVTGPFGSEFNVENYTNNGQYRYIRGKDVKYFFPETNDNVYIPEEDFNRLSKYALKEGDLLISVVGTLGNTVVIDSSITPSIFSCKSTLFRSKVNPHYLIAFLNCKFGRQQLERSARGAVQTGLNIDDLKSILIYLPDNDTQSEIADIIKNSKIEIENSKIYYKHAEDLLLQELGLKDVEFEDDLFFIENSSDVEKAGRLDAEYFQPKYTELIDRIKASNSSNLGNIASRTKESLGFNQNDLYKYTEISDVSVSTGECTSTLMQSSELPANAKIQISGGELIISKVRPTRGAISIIPDNWENNHLLSGAFSVFKVDTPMREYLQVVLRSVIGKLQMERPTTGSSYPTITDNDVQNIIIPILPMEIQKKIADLVKKSHEARKKSKELLEEAKRKVEELIEKGE